MASSADLGSAELRSALGFAADLADCGEEADLELQMRQLPHLVGADTIIVGSLHKPPRGSDQAARLVASDDPPGFFDESAREVFGRLWEQQPVVVHHFRGFVPQPSKLSDFLSERQWRRSELYNDCYGQRLELAWEIATQIRCSRDELACAALQRAGRDFSERDRAFLEAVTPHLRSAYARVEALAQRRRRLELLERGLEGEAEAVLLVDRSGRIVAAAPGARAILHDWFGERRDHQSLTPELETWRRSERGSAAPTVFELRRGSRGLRLRLVPGEEEDAILIAEPRAERPDAERLRRRLPLTRRESEVLALLATGLMNAAIAHQLAISPHTVNRHVENLYAKLGVHNRAAATAAALDIAPPVAQ